MKTVLIYLNLLILVSLVSPPLVSRSWSATFAYIPDLGNNRVVRLDTNEAAREVGLGGAPYGAAVTSDGGRVLVTRTDAGIVTVIDADEFETDESQVDITVGTRPRGVAVTPDGRFAFVANFDDDTVSRIDLSLLEVSDTIQVGDGPWGVAAFYDEAGAVNRVYVTNHLQDSLSVIAEEEITEISGVGDGPLGVAVTPDGKWVYVANLEDNTVTVIRAEDNDIFAKVDVGRGPWGVAVGSQGKTVFVSNSLSDTVSAIRVSDNLVERTYQVDDAPLGVAAPLNGDSVYVVSSGENGINFIDHANQTIETLVAGELNGAAALGAFVGGAPPVAPGDLSAESDAATVINLSWTDNGDDELGFAVERRKEADTTFSEIARTASNSSTFKDSSLESETTYVYRVRAFNETSFSSYSETAQATTEESDFSWCYIGSALH